MDRDVYHMIIHRLASETGCDVRTAARWMRSPKAVTLSSRTKLAEAAARLGFDRKLGLVRPQPPAEEESATPDVTPVRTGTGG